MPAFNLLQILALYAALLGLFYIALSIPIIRIRRGKRISLGAGDDENLRRRIRAHANFAEYVPLALILIACAVITGANAWFVHACGIVLIVGRLCHARAIYSDTVPLRVCGMIATFGVIVAASLFTLVGFFA
tara:strand:+ start:7961 stop:8356 length:396 start_codon:yes stop_codon:yes gene_type:complete